MTAAPLIVGIGHALVDILAEVTEETVARHGLAKASMHLVEADAADALYAEVGPGVRQSGGSVANSIAHVRAEGAAAVYLGKVAADELGDAFAADFASLGIGFPVARLDGGAATGRCVVMVTPDGERTMSTHLGAARLMTPGDMAAMPARADILLVEGYLWDSPEGYATIAAAAERARAAGARIALTPSDAGVVERHPEAIRAFVDGPCDIVIGNQVEMAALTGEADPEAALARVRERAPVVALTLSEKGSWVSDAAGTTRVQPVPVGRVVDTTGAGDAYAGGFLAALARGAGAAEAGAAGSRMAADVITHLGARRA